MTYQPDDPDLEAAIDAHVTKSPDMTDPTPPLSSRSVDELHMLVIGPWPDDEKALDELCDRVKRRDAEIAELRKRVDHAEPCLAFVVAAATKRNDATVHEALESIAELRKAAGVNGDRASYLFNHSQDPTT